MSTPIEDLEARVLSLPAEDRARLLELLIASFEPRTEVQKSWAETVRNRRAQVRSGAVKLVPGEEALARVRAHVE